MNIQKDRDRIKASNFKVISLNEAGYADVTFEENHVHEYFEIIWLKNGAGIHQIDMSDHTYKGPVLFFLAPGQVHKIIQHKRSQGYILKFLPSVFRQEKDFTDYLFDTCLLDTARSCPIIPVPKQMTAVIEELFSRFTEEFNTQKQGSDIILSSYLKILTTQARRIKDSYLSQEVYINKPQYNLFRKFKITVEQFYKTKHAVQDYAIHLNTQARALNSAARKFANRSALEVIQDRIVLEAKRKLQHNSQSIKELCYELGFEDPAYFTRFFKKNVGIAPQYFKTGTEDVLHPAIPARNIYSSPLVN